MTDYLFNKLTVRGNSKQVEGLRAFVCLGDSPFSLQKIEPMPVTLSVCTTIPRSSFLSRLIENGVNYLCAQNYILNDEEKRLLGISEAKQLTPEEISRIWIFTAHRGLYWGNLAYDADMLLRYVRELRADPSWSKEFIEKMEWLSTLYIHNRRKTHFDDSYAWCIANWGCKWDVDNATIVEQGDGLLVYTFFSVNSFPVKAMEKLSERFPDLLFSFSGVDASDEVLTGEFCKGRFKDTTPD